MQNPRKTSLIKYRVFRGVKLYNRTIISYLLHMVNNSAKLTEQLIKQGGAESS